MEWWNSQMGEYPEAMYVKTHALSLLLHAQVLQVVHFTSLFLGKIELNK